MLFLLGPAWLLLSIIARRLIYSLYFVYELFHFGFIVHIIPNHATVWLSRVAHVGWEAILKFGSFRKLCLSSEVRRLPLPISPFPICDIIELGDLAMTRETDK